MQQMTKSEFLSAIADALYAYSDLTDEAIERQLKQFERYFSRMSEDEAQAAIADFENIETIAANLYSLIKEKERQNTSDQKTSGNRIREYDHTASYYTVVDSHNDFDIDADEEELFEINDDLTNSGTESKADSSDTIKIDRIEITRAAIKRADTENPHASTRTIDIGATSDYDDDDFTDTHLDFTSLDGVPEHTSPMFWILLVLTFPLWSVITLTVLTLFLACFATLAALIFGLVAAMICIAAAGTGLSLFGIIYGVTQTFDVFSAGLFEIGLGVTIGGSAMFFGIISYNIAIRFLPFVMGRLTKFLVFTIRSAGRLFKRIKKECAVQ